MKATSAARLGLMLLAVLASGLAFAEDQPGNCNVPAYLLASDSTLPKVAEALKAGRPLDILVVGSRSSTIMTADATAYPWRLQSALQEKLPAATIHVSVELKVKKTAEEAVAGFAKMLEERKPVLVIWQTGTFDATRSVDPEEFREAVDEGVEAMQKAGADVILMNLQYSPRTETMISSAPYLDNMRVVAQKHEIPLFDRFAIMREWSEKGEFDLFSPSPGIDLAKRVHDCVGRALADLVIDAARINPVELRIQR
ncbi:SGNH/GDSL hydrolase family protein [Rhodopseudomonas palustris]|uniref:SGNH/GDSL hydrolase family protein n=1 Tax=Rhodopseudomonas palustris (strain BisB18) TaxID=316056 RepID=Q20WQ3_RHOPB